MNSCMKKLFVISIVSPVVWSGKRTFSGFPGAFRRFLINVFILHIHPFSILVPVIFLIAFSITGP